MTRSQTLKVQRKNIERHLVIKGQKVENLADLELFDGTQSGREVRGHHGRLDTKVVEGNLAGEK